MGLIAPSNRMTGHSCAVRYRVSGENDCIINGGKTKADPPTFFGWIYVEPQNLTKPPH
jgi:hypothetical protein